MTRSLMVNYHDSNSIATRMRGMWFNNTGMRRLVADQVRVLTLIRLSLIPRRYGTGSNHGLKSTLFP